MSALSLAANALAAVGPAAVAVTGSSAALVVLALIFGGKHSGADPVEVRRREQLSLTGRLTDGTVLDAQVITAADGRESILLVYSYSVSGVQYECSQDVTSLRHLVDVHSCRLGLPTNIKYETNNPGNSIVVSESWKGLH